MRIRQAGKMIPGIRAGIFLLFLLFFFQTAPANPVKKAWLLIRKGLLKEAREELLKAAAKGKDDFGTDYLYSHYYLSPYRKTLSLDSAYFHCLQAIEKFRKESPEGRKRYEKVKAENFRLDSAELFSRKDYLDSLGFSRAQNLESESAYQWFLDNFPQSRRTDQAREKRASLAFARARQENSYQAFERFLEKYPNAGEAVEAREIKELMVFQNTAKKGKLADWEEFIRKQANNRYIIKAHEKIYQLSTRLHDASSYYSFISRYPENPNISKAWEWIFYLEDPAMNLRQFSQKYPGFPEKTFEDQIQLRNIQVIPFTERGKFGWMDTRGKTIIRARFDSISEEARCEAAGLHFLKAFRKGKVVVFSSDSFPATAGEFEDAEWFQDGVIKVFRDGKEGLFHLAGYPLLEARYEKIHRLNSNFLAIEQGNKKYLFTAKGNSIELPGADDIIAAGHFLALRSGSKYALISETDVLKSLENEPPNPDYRYRSLETAGNGRLLLYEGDDACLLSNDKIIRLKTAAGASITPCEWGMLLEKNGMVSLIDSNGNAIGGEFQAVQVVGNSAVVKSGSRFGLMSRNGILTAGMPYDSLAFFCPGIFQAWKGNRRALVFESGKEIPFSGNRSPELLRSMSEKGSSRVWFVSVSDSLGRKAVFSRNGRAVLPFSWEQVNMCGQGFISIGADRRFGLADTSGKILLKPVYTGISALNNEFVCVARGKELSVISPFNQKVLVSGLSGAARSFGNSKSMFIIRLQDRAGIVDNQGKMVVPCQYEDIMYWNPGRCLVKKNGFWYGYLLNGGKELVKAMKKVRLLMELENEQLYEVESDGKVGIESTLRGEIAATLFDQIVPFEYPGGVCFFLGSRVQQSSVYTLLYIDSHGNPIKTQYLTEDEYEGILCD